jgi:hypothetical protein
MFIKVSIGDAVKIMDFLEELTKKVERECQEFGIDRNDSICPELESLIKKIATTNPV